MPRLAVALVLALPLGCTPVAPPAADAPVALAPPPAARYEYDPALPRPDAPVVYMSTRPEVVEAMLKLAAVKPGETVCDLGCGDGRIPVAAVRQFGAGRGLGIDFDAARIKDCERTVAAAGLTPEQTGRLTFKQGDVLKMTAADFKDVDVVTLYLLSAVNEKLAPVLRAGLKPGARVVSNSFEIGDWKPDREEQVKTPVGNFRILLWTIN